MARRKLPESFEVIQDIAQRAAAGDSAAYKELGQINRHLARVANDRLRALEKKSGTATAAYGFAEKASRTTGTGGPRPRFSEAVKGSEEELLRKAEDAYRFLNYRSSTISGLRKQEEGVVKGLKEAGYEVGDKRAFMDFMRSSAWSEMKRIYGTTNTKTDKNGNVISRETGAMTIVTDAISRGASLRELMQAYEDRQEAGRSAFAVIDDWATMYEDDSDTD